ncbi:hypothetical protein [Granulosicoccus antarcticus]|uniref:hypothetical protein n=1 Tax=Granulosicoccus antarcticus TaxID=437505 RepID=UPI0012FD75CA|nr:hypothetical protein [Granulosicoccus antarcticus]
MFVSIVACAAVMRIVRQGVYREVREARNDADDPLATGVATGGGVSFKATRLPEDTDAAIVQALEDKLWQAERPLLGRMGAC